jgi:hypothetical protein
MTPHSVRDNIPTWKVSGDWFDVCKRNLPSPCIFIHYPSYGDCDGIFAYHIKNGYYGQTTLDGLNILVLTYFQGNFWAGNTKASIAIFLDKKADQQQWEAMQMIFSGKAGGFMAQFAKLIGAHHGVNFTPISIDIADDLSYWSAELPEKVMAEVEALIGPLTPPGKRVQAFNAPGSELGPGTVVTWGRVTSDEGNPSDVGYKRIRRGRLSKHISFEWSGP